MINIMEGVGQKLLRWVGLIILIAIVIGMIATYFVYKNPPQLGSQQYNQNGLPVATPGGPLGNALYRGFCVSWGFPFAGKELFGTEASGITNQQCQAVWTGEAHSIDFIPALVGLVATVLFYIFFVWALVATFKKKK